MNPSPLHRCPCDIGALVRRDVAAGVALKPTAQSYVTCVAKLLCHASLSLRLHSMSLLGFYFEKKYLEPWNVSMSRLFAKPSPYIVLLHQHKLYAVYNDGGRFHS